MQWRGLLVAVGTLAAAAPAASADSAARAERAAAYCQSGDADAAARELTALLAEVQTELGENSDSAQVVRLNLAHVQRARGNESEARQLEDLPAESAGKPPGRALKRALRALRSCATLEPKPAAQGVEVALGDRINLARNQLNRGKFREARKVALDAKKSAGADAEPRDLMRLNETLALIHLQLGQTAAALEAAEAADRYAARLGENNVRITVARLALQLGDLEGAGQRLDEIEAAGGSPAERAELEEARGDLWLRLGSPRRALGYLDRALSAHRKVYGASHISTAAVLQLRGDAQRAAGDFPAAMASYNEALALRKSVLGPDHADTARTLNAIGVLRGDLGDWQAADASFGDALRKLEAALGSEHPEILTVRANRALARWGETQSDAAAQGYAGVVDALRAKLGADHPSVAAAVRNLAKMEFELGRSAQAEALLQQALEAQTKSLGADHPALAPTRLARARIQAHRGALAEAAAEVDRAIAVLSTARGEDHPVVVRARALAARIAVAMGDDARAFQQAREASRALARYTRHTFGAISDRQRALLAEDAEEVVGALLSVESAPPRELFLALLPHRDAVLRSIAAGRAAGGGGGELAALRQRYVAAVLGAGPNAAKRVKKLAAQIDSLEARAAGGAQTPERDPAEVLARACKHLPKDAALLKLAAFDRTPRGRFGADEPGYAALVVRGGSCAVQRISLPDGAGIQRAAEAFARAMREERADDRASREALRDALLTPLTAALRGAERWLVIPDGALWGVPIGALPDPEQQNRYLFERVTLGYLTSTYELAEAEPGKAIAGHALHSLLVGAPEFGDGAGPVVLTAAGPCQMTPFEPLPATAREIQDIEGLVGQPTELVGAQVTKSGIESALAGDPWLVHFATHAYFAGGAGCGSSPANGDDLRGEDAPIAPNPLLLSGIVLAGANQPDRVGSGARSGILTAYEVSGLDLQSAGLVVLSACDTGTGLQLRGQEVQGLRWGFRAAGARALVTSLWRSNDVATRRLMRAFYEALASGELEEDAFRGAAALRQAQLAQVETERRLGMQQPASWANFIFSGVL